MVKLHMTDTVARDTSARQRGASPAGGEPGDPRRVFAFTTRDIVHKADFATERELPPQLIIAIPLESRAPDDLAAPSRTQGCRIPRVRPHGGNHAILYRARHRAGGGPGAQPQHRPFPWTTPGFAHNLAHKARRKAFAQTFSRHLSRVDWTLPAALGQIAEALNLTSSQNASEMLMRKALPSVSGRA